MRTASCATNCASDRRAHNQVAWLDVSKGPKGRKKSTGPRNRSARGASFGLGGGTASSRSPEPELHREVLSRLHRDDPLPLLVYASTLAAALEPDSPLERRDANAPALNDIIGMFRETGHLATDALLLVLAAFAADDVLARRVSSEVAGRRHPLPSWLTRLAQFRPAQAISLGHVLGDGENVIVGIDAPAGDLTLVFFIDHNAGTVVTDAYPIDMPFDEVIARLRELGHDEVGLTETCLSLADARARIEQAIELGRMTHPPYETDTWPLSRPLAEWMLRAMPAGGTGYPVPDDDLDVSDLVAQLAASADPAVFDTREGSDDLDLAETLLEFAGSYFDADPLRWSPITVEMLLADLIPRKLHADRLYLDRVPDVMREVIVFAHRTKGMPDLLTEETLSAVDEYEPEFRVRADVPENPHRTLMREFGPGDPYAYFKAILAAQAGGIDAIRSLDVTPLSPQPLSLHAIPPDIHEKVLTAADIAGGAADDLFDAELRTAVNRVIERVAASDPAIFRRNSKVEMTAAALLWIAGTVNDAFGQTTVKDMMAHLGLKGSPSQRAEPMLRALGVTQVTGWSYDATLGDPALLTSAKRRSLAERWEDLQDATWLDDEDESVVDD